MSLQNARVLGQVDKKFIACVLDSTLVLIDQHAADERVSIEGIIEALCQGFLTDEMEVTELASKAYCITLPLSEADLLSRSEVQTIMKRWGLHLEMDVDNSDSDYLQLEVKAVPAILNSRLGGQSGSEMVRLLQLYLPVLEEHLGEIQALLANGGNGERFKHAISRDWGQALRWMPREMLDLANSKACRGMFFDLYQNVTV